MVSCRFGGVDGFQLDLEDRGDLVVVRSNRRGARHDVSPLSRRSFTALDQLTPLFGFPASGVGVYAAPEGDAEELAVVLHEDPEVQFAGKGLRDQYGAAVVYTENLFVKFLEEVPASRCEDTLQGLGLSVQRALSYAPNAYFTKADSAGRRVFSLAEELLARNDVELCHPELVRERRTRGAFPQQWHLQSAVVDGQVIDAHAKVVAAWEVTQGEGVVICVLDDGVDIDHEEFSTPGKIVAPRSFSKPRSDDPRPAEGDNHGTACSGVACAEGRHGAAGVAPKARLMPLRNVSGVGSQEEADAFVWAADNGADVISCSWGPPCGRWWIPHDPLHDQIVPLPDHTRLAIDYAIANGRGGRGCVITWAAGNGNESVDNDGYAAYEKVIAVAACNDTDNKCVYSDFGDAIWCSFPSNDFPTDDGQPPRTPGIWTTDRTGREGYNSGDTTLGDARGHYTNSFGGTSSACPGVAGVVALILARNPELRWSEGKEILKKSCDRIDDSPGEYDQQGHSRRYGFGRVNAATAVKLSAPNGVSR